MERVGYVAPFESSENYRLQIGDILFSNINSVEYIGNTAFIDKDYNLYHGMNLLRLIPKKELVIPFYLYLVLNTNRLLNHFETVCNNRHGYHLKHKSNRIGKNDCSDSKLNESEQNMRVVPNIIYKIGSREIFYFAFT